MIDSPLDTGKNLNEVQRMNRSLILSYLERSDICSRVELAKKSGLKQATITNIINDFINWGVVVETGIIAGKKGRRSIGITLNASRYHIIGIRLTRKYFQVGLFDLKGKVLFSETNEIAEGESPRSVLARMIEAAHHFEEPYKGWPTIAIGLSVPGPYLTEQGTIHAVMNSPGWEEICLRDEFKKEFDIPVIVEHDAKAGALAEWWVSTDAGDKKSIVYMALGQGIGTGILNHGQILYGRNGIAGEMAYIRFPEREHTGEDKGCLTDYASTTNFLREVRRRQKAGEETNLPENFRLADLLVAIRSGNPIVLEEYHRLVEYYSVALTNIIWCYSPDVIILGDEMTALGEMLVRDMMAHVTKNVPAVFLEGLEIKTTSFGEDPAFIGTAALVVEYAIRNPEIFQLDEKE